MVRQHLHVLRTKGMVLIALGQLFDDFKIHIRGEGFQRVDIGFDLAQILFRALVTSGELVTLSDNREEYLSPSERGELHRFLDEPSLALLEAHLKKLREKKITVRWLCCLMYLISIFLLPII